MIMNKRKELIGLFKEYIKNKNNRPYIRSRNLSSIFFYEWSNVERIPLKFETYKDFDAYLKRANICIESWQVNGIMTSLESDFNVYITCKTGKKELIIRTSHMALYDALNNYNKYGVTFVPQNVNSMAPYDSKYGW